MKVIITGQPKTSKGKYASKAETIKAHDNINILCLAKMLQRVCDPKKLGYIELDFTANKFKYSSDGFSFYELDGSSESVLHLLNTEWLVEKLMASGK